MVHSLTSNQHTLLLPSMFQRINGRSLRESKLKHLDSHSFKPLLVLLNLTTNIVESMQVTGIHTRTLLQSLIQSFKNIMESLLTPSTHLTWMLPRSMAISMLMSQFILQESELVDPLMDLDCLLESQRISVLELRVL